MDASQFGKKINDDRLWTFEFKGKTYDFYTHVNLTKEAKEFLGATSNFARLCRICRIDGEPAYEYQYQSGQSWEEDSVVVTTCPPKEMIAEIAWQYNEGGELARSLDPAYAKYKMFRELCFSRKRRGTGCQMYPYDSSNTRYSFMFQGKEYLVGSIVRITDKAQKLIKCPTNKVILSTIYKSNDDIWRYSVKWGEHDSYKGWQTWYSATPHPPETFIEEVITPMTYGFVERDLLGINASSYKEGKSEKVKDENPVGSLKNSIIYCGVMLGSFIFKDWYMTVVICAIATGIYVFYRNTYDQAHTVYVHEEDIEMQKKINEVMYARSDGNE